MKIDKTSWTQFVSIYKKAKVSQFEYETRGSRNKS